MCGITGWISFTEDLRQRRRTVDAMVDTMANRGPNASGVWIDNCAAIGHRRLAVVDLEGGVQPMLAGAAHLPVVLTFSGEIYNFVELRSELRRLGHSFATQSDTEVVLRAYLQWGDDLVDRLNGMYAFALWDARKERLLLVRDRLGVKPLYVYPLPQGLLFGSEPKAIFANEHAARVVDMDGLREALAWTRTPGKAVWRGMREIPPGGLAVFDRNGLTERRYWKLTATPHADSIGDTVQKVRHYLNDIVERQLVADVPSCTLLSGGLDSSAITALAQKYTKGSARVRSYSVDFAKVPGGFAPDAFRDSADGPFAELVSRHVGTEHHSIVLDGQAIADPQVRRAVIAARDLPAGFGDADNSLYLLFRSIRDQATVALSGESADEVFGGYKWLHQPQARDTRAFPWIDFTHVTSPKTGLEVFDPGLVANLDLVGYAQACYDDAIQETPRLEEDAVETRMRQLCYLHLTRYLRILLDRKDRISMAVGLEVRVPFCDHRLVEYVFNVPWSMKTFDGREKSLLRASVADVLPEEVLNRRKAPYPSTKDLSYVEALKSQLSELAASRGTHPVFDLVDRRWLAATLRLKAEDTPPAARNGMERMLDMAVWLETCNPSLKLQ